MMYVYEHWTPGESGELELQEVSDVPRFQIEDGSQVFITEYSPSSEDSRATFWMGEGEVGVPMYEHWVPGEDGQHTPGRFQTHL